MSQSARALAIAIDQHAIPLDENGFVDWIVDAESVQPDPVNAKPRKAVDAPAGAQTPAWSTSASSQPAATGVPWAGQNPPKPAERPAATGPAWLNG
jgi:hypothetical protein